MNVLLLQKEKKTISVTVDYYFVAPVEDENSRRYNRKEEQAEE